MGRAGAGPGVQAGADNTPPKMTPLESHPMLIKSTLALVVAGVALVAFGVGAGWMALRLIRGNRAAVIASLPLVPEQTVRVEAPGELVVSIEVPRLATDFRQWEFEVVETSAQRVHRMTWGGPRATGKVSGISTVKIPLGRVTLAQADHLAVRVEGLAADGDYSAYHIVLARPHLARIALQVLGLVFCGVGMLLSLLWGLWQLGVVKPA
jgi:hypothetical protein